MISAGDFRNGITLEIDGQVVQILEFQHVKPGKGAAFVRTKLKNVINGGVVERTFRPTEKFPAARIDRVAVSYTHLDVYKRQIVANNLKVEGAGFGTDTNVVTIITKDSEKELPKMSKEQVADELLTQILDFTS